MSTALNMWMLFPQISDNTLHLGRDDIFYRIEGLRNRYSDARQILDNPMSDLPRYRELLRDSSALLNFIYQEGEKTPELLADVGFNVVSGSYARLIARGLRGEVMTGTLADRFKEDGEFGQKIFYHLIKEMEQEGLDTGNLHNTAFTASLGSENAFTRQLGERQKQSAVTANYSNSSLTVEATPPTQPDVVTSTVPSLNTKGRSVESKRHHQSIRDLLLVAYATPFALWYAAKDALARR